MSALPPKLQSLLDDLSMFVERAERIDALVSLGQRYKPISPAEVPRDEGHRVKSCESEVYVSSKTVPGLGLKYLIAVDNPQGISAMALAEILDEGLSGEDPQAVASVPEDIVYRVFGRELSMGKSMGLIGIVQMVKQEAAKALKR